jgi:16S rRNA processing protein RimM
MAENQYVSIGYTKKAHGIGGELKLHIEERYLEDFLKNERIFLEVKGTKLPYFVENVRGKGELILQLESVNNRDTAFLLQSREVFLRQQDLLSDAEREFEPVEADSLAYAQLSGYLLRDKTLGDIGTIAEVLDMPQQEMALLQYRNRDVLVPLNAQLILDIDPQQRIVLMDLPDGLLE